MWKQIWQHAPTRECPPSGVGRRVVAGVVVPVAGRGNTKPYPSVVEIDRMAEPGPVRRPRNRPHVGAVDEHGAVPRGDNCTASIDVVRQSQVRAAKNRNAYGCAEILT